MQVFIMRHGDAALDAASDAQRPLTLCGQDESRQIASWLSEQSVDIDQILVSPYLRARQTLEVVREVMALPAEPEVMPELTPGGDAAFICSYLQALAKEDCAAVLVISHLHWSGIWSPSFAQGNALRCLLLQPSPVLISMVRAKRVRLIGR